LLSPLKRILIAEGDELVLALITHILTRQGYAVEVALTADQASARLKDRRYDVTLMEASILEGVVADVDGRRLIVIAPRNLDIALKPHAVIAKPIEFGLLIDTVAACITAAD
jgi:hypothetical protein